jgi:hypothetical protein
MEGMKAGNRERGASGARGVGREVVNEVGAVRMETREVGRRKL